MIARTVEDRLRQEYADLQGDLAKVLLTLKTEVEHALLPRALKLKHHERLEVSGRTKTVKSAIDKLRRQSEGNLFDEGQPTRYSLTNLTDLVGVRVLVFPGTKLEKIHAALQERYPRWQYDPVKTGDEGSFRAHKYVGFCSASKRIKAELQIAPMLTGLFWDVEHDAFYKPLDPTMQGVAEELAVKEKVLAVYDAFAELEAEVQFQLQAALKARKSGRKT